MIGIVFNAPSIVRHKINFENHTIPESYKL